MAKRAALDADAVKKVTSMWKSDRRNWSLMTCGLATPDSVKPEPKMAPVRRLVATDVMVLMCEEGAISSFEFKD